MILQVILQMMLQMTYTACKYVYFIKWYIYTANDTACTNDTANDTAKILIMINRYPQPCHSNSNVTNEPLSPLLDVVTEPPSPCRISGRSYRCCYWTSLSPVGCCTWHCYWTSLSDFPSSFWWFRWCWYPPLPFKCYERTSCNPPLPCRVLSGVNGPPVCSPKIANEFQDTAATTRTDEEKTCDNHTHNAIFLYLFAVFNTNINK